MSTCLQCQREVSAKEIQRQDFERFRMAKVFRQMKRQLDLQFQKHENKVRKKILEKDMIDEKIKAALPVYSNLFCEEKKAFKLSVTAEMCTALASMKQDKHYFYSSRDDSGLHMNYKYAATVVHGCSRLHYFASVPGVAEILASVRKESIFSNIQFLENICSKFFNSITTRTSEFETIIYLLASNKLCNCLNRITPIHNPSRCLFQHDDKNQCIKTKTEKELRDLINVSRQFQKQLQELDVAMYVNLQNPRNHFSNPPTCCCTQPGGFNPLWESDYKKRGYPKQAQKKIETKKIEISIQKKSTTNRACIPFMLIGTLLATLL